ncbi:MAG: spermidine synthase [Methylocystis sp.]
MRAKQEDGIGVSDMFEELDYCVTSIGSLSLRRRRAAPNSDEIFEIKLGEAFLMSSLFTVAEIALAQLGLAETTEEALDVVVGGLGLGCTAQAALSDARVRSLLVVEALAPVIEWHERGLLPLGKPLTDEPRCRFLQGDFFALVASHDGFDPRAPQRRFHAILVDIDHSIDDLLHPSHAALYRADGLRRIAAHLFPGGVFALWSNDPPDEAFCATLAEIFASVRAEVVGFHDPLHPGREAENTIYIAKSHNADGIRSDASASREVDRT